MYEEEVHVFRCLKITWAVVLLFSITNYRLLLIFTVMVDE